VITAATILVAFRRHSAASASGVAVIPGITATRGGGPAASTSISPGEIEVVSAAGLITFGYEAATAGGGGQLPGPSLAAHELTVHIHLW